MSIFRILTCPYVLVPKAALESPCRGCSTDWSSPSGKWPAMTQRWSLWTNDWPMIEPFFGPCILIIQSHLLLSYTSSIFFISYTKTNGKNDIGSVGTILVHPNRWGLHESFACCIQPDYMHGLVASMDDTNLKQVLYQHVVPPSDAS